MEIYRTINIETISMKTFILSIALLLSCSVWAGNTKDGKIFAGLLSRGSIEVYGLDRVTKEKELILSATHQGASVTFLSGENPWDFSPFVHLVCEIQNLANHELFVECHIDGDYWSTGAGYIPARSTRKIETLILRKEYSKEQLELFPKMNGLPGGAARLWCGYRPETIYKFSLDFPRIQSGDRMIIKDVTLNVPYKEYSGKEYQALLPFVDEFGQYIPTRYTGKISSTNDIIKADKKEEQDIKKHPGNKSWDVYGGWGDGPQLKATGHFRVEKHQDKWWLIDPLGHLFWSHGITCVGGGDDTNIKNREKFYSPLNLPVHADSSVFISEGNDRKDLSYWKLNMYRKWGADYKSKMIDKANRRLKSWNINTIANWSNEEIIRTKKTPYTAVIHTQYGHFIQDPFSPDFQKGIEKTLSHSPAANDEWCIGYFVDNELGWGNDTYLATLTLQGRYPYAKKEFMNRLIEKYASLNELNTTWGSKFSTWDEWMENDSVYAGAKNDLADFTVHAANTYFRCIKDALKVQAPDKLYLGCRFNYGDFAGNSYQQWIVDIAAKYCDIVSFNRYTYSAYSLHPSKGRDFPMIIGEFHFGGLDRGLLHGGLRYGGNQTNRADLYKHYVQDAMTNPHLVGTHWFQYNDQAVTGRGDGENYQIGFINVYDAPNQELIDAARAAGNSMYELRSNK